VGLNLRTTPEDDEVLDRLAAGWGMSKQQALLRAARAAVAQLEADRRYEESSGRMREQWAQTLEILAES
jgi:uncharacterized protein (DUF1778 family)